MGLEQIFSQNSRIDKAVRETVEIRETTMIFKFEKLAKAYVLYRIKTVYVCLKKKYENFAD